MSKPYKFGYIEFIQKKKVVYKLGVYISNTGVYYNFKGKKVYIFSPIPKDYIQDIKKGYPPKYVKMGKPVVATGTISNKGKIRVNKLHFPLFSQQQSPDFKTLKELIISENLPCDKGTVKQVLIKVDMDKSNIGPFFDVLCVVLRKKPLAALGTLDYFYKKKSKKLNYKLINQIIDEANKKGVKTLQLKKRGGMYIKTIFYYPSQKQNAYKLAYLLWADDNEFNFENLSLIFVNYMVGILLGYSTVNIKQFFLQNHNFQVSTDGNRYIRKQLKELKGYKKWVKDKIIEKKIQQKNKIINVDLGDNSKISQKN